MSSASQQWLQDRRGGIGGSQAAAILNLSPWQSALALYCDKVGLTRIEDAEPDWLYWGKALEPAIAERYAKETGRKLHNFGEYFINRSEKYPWMCCTIDRGIYETEGKIGPGILSIKNVAGFKKTEWADEPPVHYQIQLQHEMIVLDLKWGSFAVLFNGQEFGWFDVERNDRFCEYLIEQERLFWDRVQRQDPPPPDAPASSSAEAIKRLYPGENGESIGLDGTFIEEVSRLDALKVSRKSCDEEIAEIENRIKAAIGDNTFGVLPNGQAFSLKTTKRNGYTVEPTSFRTLRKVKT